MILSFLIILQGILFALLLSFQLSSHYFNAWDQFNHQDDQAKIYLKNLSEEESRQVASFFQSYQDHLFFNVQDSSQDMEGLKDITYSVYGNPALADEFTIFNKKLVTQNDLAGLLNNPNLEARVGYADTSKNSLKTLPAIQFSPLISIQKLEARFDEKKSMSGVYYIQGFETEEAYEVFVSDLGQLIQRSPEELTETSSDYYNEPGFLDLVFLLLIFVNAGLICLIVLLQVFQNYQNIASFSLLGWSKRNTAFLFFSPLLKISMLANVFIPLIAWLVSHWSEVSIIPLAGFYLYGLLATLSIGLACLIACLPLLLTNTIDQIHSRLPARPLLLAGLVIFGAVLVGVVAASGFLDLPVQELADFRQTYQAWSGLSKLEVPHEIEEGDDFGLARSSESQTFSEDALAFYRDYYYYPGLYFHYIFEVDQERLDEMRGSYAAVPNQPYWELTASQSLLEEYDFDLEENWLEEAKQGKRVYLIPDTFSEDDQKQIEQFTLEILATLPDTGKPQTIFEAEGQVLFHTYTPGPAFNTWSKEVNQARSVKDPVIYLAHPNNFSFFEYANLFATDLNAYLKVADKETVQEIFTPESLAKYHLTDNQISFTSVQSLVDGRQKSIRETLYLFGGILLLAFLVLLGVLYGLILLYQLINRELIYTKRLLGYSFLNRYRPVLLLIFISFIFIALVSILIRSKLGLLMAFAVLLAEILLLFLVFWRQEDKKTLAYLKEGS